MDVATVEGPSEQAVTADDAGRRSAGPALRRVLLTVGAAALLTAGCGAPAPMPRGTSATSSSVTPGASSSGSSTSSTAAPATSATSTSMTS